MAGSSNSRTTLRDVAKAAGVSHMTVLRTVEGSPLVAPKTAKRVRHYLKKLDYRRDPVLSALSAYRRTGKARASGHVLAFIACDGSEYSKKVLQGLQDEATWLGYGVESFTCPPTTIGQARLSKVLYHRNIRGLLFGPSDTATSFEGWTWEHFAPISLGALSHQPPMNAVAMDYFHGATIAMGYLGQQGSQRIGLAVDAQLQRRTDNRWLGGCLSTGQWLSVYSGAIKATAAVQEWIRKKHIDGIITIHQSIYQIAQAQRIPCAFLNNLDCPPGVPRLCLDPEHIGQQGVRMLHHALLRGELGLPDEPQMLSIRGVWTTS